VIAAIGIVGVPVPQKRVAGLALEPARDTAKPRLDKPHTPRLNVAIVSEKDAVTIPRSITLLQFQTLR
jgi:hypothetical protein